MHDKIAFGWRGIGHCEMQNQCARDLVAGRVDIDERHMDIGNCSAAQVADNAPTTPTPTIAMRSPRLGLASHTALSAVFHVGGEHGTGGRQALGQPTAALPGMMKAGLMRVERKDHATAQLARPCLDLPNHRIPVFDRERESAVHEWSPHAVEFGCGDPTPQREKRRMDAESFASGASVSPFLQAQY